MLCKKVSATSQASPITIYRRDRVDPQAKVLSPLVDKECSISKIHSNVTGSILHAQAESVKCARKTLVVFLGILKTILNIWKILNRHNFYFSQLVEVSKVHLRIQYRINVVFDCPNVCQAETEEFEKYRIKVELY